MNEMYIEKLQYIVGRLKDVLETQLENIFYQR